MAQRSYLLVAAQHGPLAILEAANGVPLLWLGLLDASTAAGEWTAGVTMRLAPGPAVGITFAREAALRRLAARRAGIVAWVGEAAGTVLDQFTRFVDEQAAPELSLDLSEWVELFDSREQALAALHASVAALDAKVGKRRPPAVRQLLDAQGLIGREAHEPAFGVLLAGTASIGREPWRRDPPRERRAADDVVTWSRQSDRHFVSRDGRVVATTVTNATNVETPVIWSPQSSERVTRASAVPDEIGYLHPQRLSADGNALFCSVTWHPGPVARTLCFGPDGMRVLHEGDAAFGVSACSATGDVAAGALYGPSPEPARAAIWRDGLGVQTLPEMPADAVVTALSGDGQLAGVESRSKDAAGQYGGTQAWTWSAEPARRGVVAEGWHVTWVALSDDGRRGVLSVQAEKSGSTCLHHWQDGGRAVPIECGAATRTEVAFSPDLGCALARTDDALKLWRADGTIETVMATDGLIVDPRHVSSAGDWWVATERDTSNYATAAVLLWTRDGGVKRFAAPASTGRLGLGLYVASACESLDDLVLLGQWRDGGEPVTWSPAEGFVEWGKAPRPVPSPPIDFTPITQGERFVFATMPDRDQPMRERVQAFQAVYPGLTPMLYVTADWCEPCRELEPLLKQPALQRLLRGHLLLRVDVDRVGIGSRSIGFQAAAVPAFIAMDDTGRATGRMIDGGAWDETTEANVTAALSGWLSDADGSFMTRGAVSDDSSSGGPSAATGLAPDLSPALVFLLALGAGLGAASVYYSHPLLPQLQQSLGTSVQAIGLVPTLVQLGYAAGILLLAPLGDRYDRRLIITLKAVALTLGLAATALSTGIASMYLACLFTGVMATLAQDAVPAAATLAPEAKRGPRGRHGDDGPVPGRAAVARGQWCDRGALRLAGGVLDRVGRGRAVRGGRPGAGCRRSRRAQSWAICRCCVRWCRCGPRIRRCAARRSRRRCCRWPSARSGRPCR